MLSVPATHTGLLHNIRPAAICGSFPWAARHRRSSSSKVSRLITADSNAATEWHETRLKHVLESQQFSQAALATVFATATEMEAVKRGTPEARQLEGYIMSTLFYEPSTRTRLSFESAMSRLGGTVLSTESAGEYSSAAKGETLEGASCLMRSCKEFRNSIVLCCAVLCCSLDHVLTAML